MRGKKFGLVVKDIDFNERDFGDEFGATVHRSQLVLHERLRKLEEEHQVLFASLTWNVFLENKDNCIAIAGWIINTTDEIFSLRRIDEQLEKVSEDITKQYGRKVMVMYGLRLDSMTLEKQMAAHHEVSYTFKKANYPKGFPMDIWEKKTNESSVSNDKTS